MFRKLFMIGAACSLLVACGEAVEVPPAHVGKVLTKNGYKPDTVPPSKFRLDWCWWYCDRLVLVQAADFPYKEEIRIFMPRDQLNLAADVRLTLAIDTAPEALDSIFAKVTPRIGDVDGDGERDQVVTVSQVYETYGQPIVRDVVRSVLAKHEINEIASSREAVNAEIAQAIRDAFAHTPLVAKRVGLGDVQFPEIIVAQKEAAAKRRIEIERAEADKQVQLVELQTQLEVAKARRAIEREKAEAIREANAIYAESVSERWLQYRQLEVLEKMAVNPNTVFVPYGALDEVGMSQRMYSEQARVQKQTAEAQ